MTTAELPSTTDISDDEPTVDTDRHRIYRAVRGKVQAAVPRRIDSIYTPKELGRRSHATRERNWNLFKRFTRHLSAFSQCRATTTSTTSVRSLLLTGQAAKKYDHVPLEASMSGAKNMLVYSSKQSTIATSPPPESERNGACTACCRIIVHAALGHLSRIPFLCGWNCNLDHPWR